MKKNGLQSNAKVLLQEYRPAIWRKLAIETMPGVYESFPSACTEQICFTRDIVEKLRNHKLLGEKLFWIIYSSYMTNNQPDSVDEILSDIAQKYKPIPRRSYFRLKERAIEMLDELLNEIEDGKVAA